MTTRLMVLAALLGFVIVAGAIMLFTDHGGAISQMH